MNLEEMQHQFFNAVWFDPGDRPKTALAMQHLIERVSDDVFDELCVKVFAPPPQANGQTRRLGPNPEHYFIYLAPFLESKPQEEVDFIVAHEFAHAYLRHGSTSEGTIEDVIQHETTVEAEADALVVKWGFVVPDRRDNAFRALFKKVSSLSSEIITKLRLSTQRQTRRQVRWTTSERTT